MSGEQWRPVPSWEGAYEVSDLGRVRSLDREVFAPDQKGVPRLRRYRGRVLKAAPSANGYPRVALQSAERLEYRHPHVLVAAAFLGPRPPGQEVCHANGDPLDSRLANLRYGTRRDNALDRHQHGTMNLPQGEAHPCHKLTEKNVTYIRQSTASNDVLSLAFGVHPGTIYSVRARKTWRHI